MKISNRVVQVLIILNVVMLAGMYLFCFQNSCTSIPEECTECNDSFVSEFVLETFFIIIQMIYAVVMCFVIKKLEQGKGQGVVIPMSCLGMGNSFILSMLFSSGYSISTHEEFSAESLALIEMFELQYEVGHILGMVLIVLNLLLLISAIWNMVMISKELKNRKKVQNS